MRTARVLLWLTLALAFIALALYALRLPLASYGARAAMENAGLDNARVKVTVLSLNTVRLESVSAGPDGAEGLVLESLEAQFRLGRLLSARAVDALSIGPGTVRMRISPDGEVSIPGVTMPSDGESGDSGAAPLPFDRLTLNDVALIVDAPEGGGAGTVTADYDIYAGGRVVVSAASEMAAWKALRIGNAALDLDLQLDADGRTQLSALASGDFLTPDGAVRAASVVLEGEGASWRDAAAGARDALSFRGRIAVENVEALLAQSPSLTALAASPWAAAVLGDAVQAISVSGDAFVDVAPGRIALTLDDAAAPLALSANTGAKLTLTGLDNAPVFILDGEGMRASAAYRLEDAPLTVQGDFTLTPLADGWRIEAPARIGAFSSEALSFDAAAIDLAAEALPETLRADLAVKTLIREAAVGPATIADAPIDAAFTAAADLADARARIGVAGECLSVPRLRIDVAAPAMETGFSGAKFCPQGEELAVIDWSDGLHLTAEGALTAQGARLHINETVFAGAPPRIDGAIQFDAATGESRLAGGFTGGQVAFNDMLILSRADGAFTLSLGAEGMRGEASMDSVRVAQNLEAPLVAPVIASGAGRLANNKASFDYALRTPDGAPLGVGRGTHDLDTGRGGAAFDIEELAFAPGGLQPETLTPVLRGVVDSATGTASGSAQFAWAPGALTSGAAIALDGLTFGGPTRVVSQTRGVTGDLRFSSLWPVATEGEQTITVTGVDLDALVMEEGEIVFELPGDDTLRIARAAFPWFGGRIGVYDATASFAGGGEALAPLRAESVDLKQVLEYVNLNGLSGEGLLSGVLPLVVEEGKASIEGGFLQSDGPGAIRYQSAATDQASAAGDQAQVAFDLLRDLRYDSLSVAINGPLDGRLSFQMRFEGSGEVAMNNQDVRVPVTYNINLDAALLELLNQANLTRDIQLQFERGLGAEAEDEDAAKE